MTERILFLSDAEVRQLVTMRDVLEVCEEVFRAMAAGQVTWGEPPLLDLWLDNRQLHYYMKACSVDTIPAAGVRIMGFRRSADGRVSGSDTRHVILLDPHSSRKLMIMDEHWTYGLRTAASPGVAARYLGRKDSRIAGVLGVGPVGWGAIWALREVFPGLEEIRVTSRRAETRERAAAEATEQFGVRVVPVESPEAAVRDADLVVAATSAEGSLIRTEWLKPGSFACALGGSPEIDLDVYWKADKVLVDDWAHCLLIPEIRELIAQGRFGLDKLYSELAPVVAGLKPGRESDRERIFLRTQGLAVQDIAIAHRIYQRACERELGVWLG